jgi:hypothetical protein
MATAARSGFSRNHQFLVFPGADPAGPSNSDRHSAVPSHRDSGSAVGATHSSFRGTRGIRGQRAAGVLGTPHLLDVDGDGRPEAVFAGNGTLPGRIVVCLSCEVR